jgi:two-component system sensor histidine kinase/response regulator
MATILVVDDVAENVEFLRRDLQKLGHHVVSAFTGTDALSVAQTEQPDLILLDIVMPELDGIEVCRRLKASPATQSIPIILVSGLAEEQNVIKGLDAGAFDYITKPFNAAVLAARVRSALRLKDAHDAMEAAAQLRSDVLATTSDELRTPLAAIREFADNLLDPDRSEEERYAAINSIRHSGDHLLQIVNDIHDLSQIEAGTLRVGLTDCSAIDVVSDVATLMQRHAEEKGLDLNVEYAGPIPERIRSDAGRLRQILLSIASNAVKFTAKGSVGIRTKFVPRGADDSRLQFDVVDTGTGLCQERVASGFKPYAQIDPSVVRDLGGAGLALSISHQLTDLLGGEMAVACTPDAGCSVRVTIPTGPLDGVVLVDGPRGCGEREEDGPRRLQECRVLFAGDDVLTQKAVSHLLTGAGASVTVAVNGPAAVGLALAAAAAGSAYDTVIMERHLSALSGAPAIQLLRERGYNGAIIGVAGPGLSDEELRNLEVLCNAVTLKPIDQVGLMETIGAIAGSR